MEFLFLLLGAAGIAAVTGIDFSSDPVEDDAAVDEQNDAAPTASVSEFLNDNFDLFNSANVDATEGDDSINVAADHTVFAQEDTFAEDPEYGRVDVAANGGNDDITLDGIQELDGLEGEEVVIDAGAGDDTVTLTGDFGSHADAIDLGAGNDTASLGFGSVVDSLILGEGADVLAMDGVYTEATVKDFNTSEDVLALDLGMSFLNGDDAIDYVNFNETDDGIVMTVTDPYGSEIYATVTLNGLTMDDVANIEIVFG